MYNPLTLVKIKTGENMKFNRLSFIRDSLEMYQKDVAELLEISKSQFSRWEIGEDIIPIKYLIKLCNLSKFSLDFALGLSEDRTKIEKDIVLNYSKIGNKIKQIRTERKLSQREFAKKLNTSHTTIYKCEKGLEKNLTSILKDIAKIYKVSIDWICK